MIKLIKGYKLEGGANYRYVNAVMLEARVRGYDGWWHDGSLSYIPEEVYVGFSEFLNTLIDWLVDNFPSEFEK